MFQFPTPQSQNDLGSLHIGKLGPTPTTPWQAIEDEGELKVDVFEIADSMIIRSTMAGTRPDDIEVFLNNDMLTIRGQRKEEHEVHKNDYHLKECYWGKFSRSLILPKHVKSEGTEATLKNGILTIKLLKTNASGNIKVREG